MKYTQNGSCEHRPSGLGFLLRALCLRATLHGTQAACQVEVEAKEAIVSLFH